MRRLLLTAAVASIAGSAWAGPAPGEITAACMTAMEETQSVCACVEQNVTATLTEDQQTFFVAIMTDDEERGRSIPGFTDDDAQTVQGAFMTSAMQCMG